MLPAGIASHTIDLDDPKVKIHYLEAGEGEPVLLLHGWPTSSYLWRNVMPRLAQTKRVIAPDLVGFGLSDKPLDASYSFRYHNKVLDAFLEKLDIKQVNLVVHDLGGPVGTYWAIHHMDQVLRLAFLNTLVYPQLSVAVKAFVVASMLPVVRHLMAGPSGISRGLKFGVVNKDRMTPELLAPYTDPFTDRDARKALLKAANSLNPKGLEDIERMLPDFKNPTRVIYGENDRILPNMPKTADRIKQDLPQTEVTVVPGCGHFLQEDEPEQIAELLAEFLEREA